jgi:hypothetical protein
MSKKNRTDGMETVRPETRKPRRRFVRWLEVLLGLVLAPLVVGFGLRRITGNDGLARVSDDEAAVLVDYASGDKSLVTMPGYRAYVPWLQEVFRFDKSPNAFVMKGNAKGDANHAPRLLVRANDGSSFWFEEFVLQYALIPDRAPFVLEDSGPADQFKEYLVRVHARAILRDEFGRFSAEDVVKPENLQAATRAALEKLNAVLQPHGIEVLEISTAKPAFDKTYEEKVARRKTASQEIEHLRAEIDTLAQEKLSREQAVQVDKDIEMKKLEGNLVRDIGSAEKELIRAKAEADLVYLDRVSLARSIQLEKTTQAAGLTTKYTALFGDAKAHALALESRGEAAVRAALIDKLPRIEFNLVPYSRDPAPQRIEHEQVTASTSPGASKGKQ